MVRAHLAAVDCIYTTHHFLDKGMTGFGLHGDASKLLHHCFGVPDETRIMNDLAAGMFDEERFGQQADDVITFDKSALFVKKEAAIEITIPRNAHIRIVCDYCIG